MISIRLKLAACVAALLASSALLAGPVNINTADAATLSAELKGVGPALAAHIVQDREKNGLFTSADSLSRVKGIGPHIIEMNRANILVKVPKKNQQ